MEKVDTFPLSQLTFAQKLSLDELTRDNENYESPSWHDDILKERETAVETGKATVSDWEEAKARIRKNVSC